MNPAPVGGKCAAPVLTAPSPTLWIFWIRPELGYHWTQNIPRIRLFLSHSSISSRGKMAWGLHPPPPMYVSTL